MRKLLAGLLIGIGCILPGVSGGVMAVSFGLYRPMLDAVYGFFCAPKKNLLFLVPLGLSITAGIALGAWGLAGAMETHERLMLFLFIGFILGSIPDLLHRSGSSERFGLSRLLTLLSGAVIGLSMNLLPAGAAGAESLSPVQALLTGLMEGVSTIIPGISSSLILIHLGWYQAYLRAFAALKIGTLALMGAGFAVSAFACMRLVRWTFDRYPAHAFDAVLGFVIASVALVFPGFGSGRALAAEIGMLVIGIVSSRVLGKIEQ